MRTREELAWAAGLFDGEGWASAARYSRKSGGMSATVTLGVAQNHREELGRFHDARRLYSPDQVRDIRRRLESGERQFSIAKALGRDRQSIHRIAAGRAYRGVV